MTTPYDVFKALLDEHTPYTPETDAERAEWIQRFMDSMHAERVYMRSIYR